MRWSLEMLELTWRAQGLAVERGGMVRAKYRGEVVEIPCELVGRAGDGSAQVCVAGRVERFEAGEIAAAEGSGPERAEVRATGAVR